MQNLSTWYQQQTTTGDLTFDQAQLELLKQLDLFLDNFASINFITRLWRKDHKLGYYIYGDVGRGKSMIMNTMYQFTKSTRKTRLHFHEFMHEIHQKMTQMQNIDDPLSIIAKEYKQHYDIIYLDEMHISDIATAMIMKRLLEGLFANQIYIVASSNYHPDDLWPNGLMRERFFPAIEIIKDRLNIVSLNSQQDYRLINNSINQLFIIQQVNSNAQLETIFNTINQNNKSYENTQIEICQREISCVKYGTEIIWLDFAVICGNMRSQLDYLEMVQKFKWFIISNIPLLTIDKKDFARRFTWLIDILYDSNSKLALSTSVPIKEIYCQGDFANEFERTISRLEEMQTHEYLEKT